MEGRDVNVGLIRDPEGIYNGLQESREGNRQLAVCYNAEDKLMVKICIVAELLHENGKVTVVLGSSDEPPDSFSVPLEHIQSIYLIKDFDHSSENQVP